MFTLLAILFVCGAVLFVNLYNISQYTQYIKTLMKVADREDVKAALQNNNHHLNSSKLAVSEYTIYNFFWMPLTIVASILLVWTGFDGYDNHFEISSVGIVVNALVLSAIFTQMAVRTFPAPALLLWGAGLVAVNLSFDISRMEAIVLAIEADDSDALDPENLAKITMYRRAIRELKKSTEKTDV